MPYKYSTGLVSLLLVLGMGMQSAIANQVVGNRNINDLHGALYVHGALTESACRLEMSSAYQSVDLGNTTTGQMLKPGDRGTPVAVRIQLHDCMRSGGRFHDERTGNVLWSPTQPAVSVGFVAPSDMDNPELMRVQGASGLGLRLTDAKKRNIRLGRLSSTPLLLAPGKNELIYYIIPERTPAAMVAGNYMAHVEFWLNYD